MTHDSQNAEYLYRTDNECLWHPFTPMQQWMAEDDEPGRIIAEARGFELIDTRGQKFIDGFSSLWCNLHGHQVEQIDIAISKQLSHASHTTLLGHGSPPSIELAERLVRISPDGLDKVFYSDSGATAVEIAMKMAFQYHRNKGITGRDRFIALKHSYHGDTVGSVSVGGMDLFHNIFRPLLFETTFVDSPNEYHHPTGDGACDAVLAQVEEILRTKGDKHCAIIAEPLMQGAAGMLTHPAGFLAGLRRLTREYGVLLICDEVATGFCRTGKLFACDHEDVCPDLMCLGKGLTGGYMPVAATLATQDVFDAFLGDPGEHKTLYHGHTFTGNALGCAAAIASIDLIFESNLPGALPAKTQLITRKLDAIRDHRNVGDIRQCGMMTGIELVGDRDNRTALDPALRTGAAICKLARKRGIIIRPLGDVVVLMPAPAMDTDTLARLLDATVETIAVFFDRETKR